MIVRNDRKELTSVSLVGDAIPGTLNADGTWNYKSNVSDMVYDETEQCYKARVITTAEDYGETFRFVGNRDPQITWYENTKTDKKKMAQYPYKPDDTSAPGHTAEANDPNQVNYTEKGENSEKDWNIIGTVLQVDGPYVFTSIPIVMVMIQRLIIITPLLQVGIWSYTM